MHDRVGVLTFNYRLCALSVDKKHFMVVVMIIQERINLMEIQDIAPGTGKALF